MKHKLSAIHLNSTFVQHDMHLNTLSLLQWLKLQSGYSGYVRSIQIFSGTYTLLGQAAGDLLYLVWTNISKNFINICSKSKNMKSFFLISYSNATLTPFFSQKINSRHSVDSVYMYYKGSWVGMDFTHIAWISLSLQTFSTHSRIIDEIHWICLCSMHSLQHQIVTFESFALCLKNF